MNFLLLLIFLSVLCLVLGFADLMVTGYVQYQENKRFAMQRSLILRV